MPARIAIIGCGYLGGALGALLAREGHDCIGTTTTPARLGEISQLGVRPLLARLDEVDRLLELLKDREIAYLTMAPGSAGQAKATPTVYHSVYFDGVKAVLAASARSPVRKYIYTSSTRVYGQDDGSWVDESSPVEPADEDGRILLAAERALLDGAAARRVTATVLRLGGIWGPGRDPAERVRRLAGAAQSGGQAYVNLIHVGDAVAALRACLDHDHHGVLNCVDGAPATRRELYDRLLADAGCAPIHWTGAAARGKRVRNDRIQKILGLKLEGLKP